MSKRKMIPTTGDVIPTTGDVIPTPTTDMITGRGGGKSDDGATSYYRQPDTISSQATARMTMVLAAGPVEGLAQGAGSIFFDGVPLITGGGGATNFGGITWQMTRGTADQSPIGLEGFNAIEQTSRVNRRLQYQIPVQRTGRGEAARLTFRFPRGLVQQNESGVFGAKVEIRIDRRRPDGRWQQVQRLVIAEKQSAVFEFQVLIPLEKTAPGGLSPSIRVTRLTPSSSDPALRDDVDLLAATWLTWERLNYPGVSTLGVSFDAESFSGRVPRVSVELKGRLVRVPSNYNPATRRSTGLWNGLFKSAWCNNPAWVLLDLLTDAEWGLGLDDRLIETYDLHAIAAYCDAEVSNGRGGVEPRFQFDGAITRRLSAVDIIGQVCAAMRVHYFWSGGRLRFIQDSPGEPVMVLTNAMVEDGVFVYSGPSMVAGFSHALVSFNDPESESGTSVEAEINTAFLSRHGYRAREVSLLGCRRRSQARRHARWLIESGRADLYGVSWHASLDHFAENPVRPGDIIRIYDSARIEGQAFPGRIIALNGATLKAEAEVAGDAPTLTGKIDYEATTKVWHQNVSVRLTRRADGAFSIRPTGGSWPVAPRVGGAMLIALGGVRDSGVNYRIIQLREVDRHRLEVNAVRHDGAIYGRIDSGFRLDDRPREDRPHLTAPLPQAQGLVVQQPARLPHGGNGRDLHISWQAEADSRIALWRLYGTGPEGESTRIEAARPPLIVRDLAVGRWNLRLRAVNWAGREGPEATTQFDVKADAASALPPTGAVITPGYGQLIITWDRDDLPPDAEVEVLEYSSRRSSIGRKVTATFGAVHILGGRIPGRRAYFRLRTRLAGGTLSALTTWLEAAALAVPEPEPHIRAAKIMARSVATTRWSDTQARYALGGDAPVEGDLVTLYREARYGTPWAETRRYDGRRWVAPGAVLSGEVLAPATVPASRLKVDSAQMEASSRGDQLRIKSVSADLITSGVLQSANYARGRDGFSINTSGTAEFNDARIRGRLEGSVIKSSLLVAAKVTAPTEASAEATTASGQRFLTLENARPLRYMRRNLTGIVLTIGPMQVGLDEKSRFLDDSYNKIISADDPYGDTPDGDNTYYSRFWSKTPRMKIGLTHHFATPRWGELVSKGAITVVMRTESGRRLATSQVISLESYTQFAQASTTARTWILDLHRGFVAGSVLRLTRSTFREPAGLRRYYTQSLVFNATLGCRFGHTAGRAANDGLVVEFHIDLRRNGTLSSNPLLGFYRSIDLEGTTHD